MKHAKKCRYFKYVYCLVIIENISLCEENRSKVSANLYFTYCINNLCFIISSSYHCQWLRSHFLTTSANVQKFRIQNLRYEVDPIKLHSWHFPLVFFSFLCNGEGRSYTTCSSVRFPSILGISTCSGKLTTIIIKTFSISKPWYIVK